MQPSDRESIPYQLFGGITPNSSLSALSKDPTPPTDEQALKMLTTLYISNMYYSALSNLYIQSSLPNDRAAVEGEMPRVKIALARSYADFTAAATWLSAVDEAAINASPAKDYYKELQELPAGAIKDIEAIYSSKTG